MSINRFLAAQKDTYNVALQEIKNGKKQSHWIWYIFPQYFGLSHSDISIYYSIKNKNEAIEYFNNPILNKRLYEITNELLKHLTNNINDIMGYIDGVKLQSCMTLFYIISNKDIIFKNVINKYYNGEFDKKTLELLK